MLLLCGATVVAHTTFAQGPKVGLEAGLNISSGNFSPPLSAYNTKFKASSKTGIRLGVPVDFKIANNCYIETGLVYSMKGLKLSGYETELRYTYHYLETPVLFTYTVKNVFVSAGPYFGIAAGGTGKLISIDTTYNKKIEIGNDSATDGIRRMDFGLIVRAGYELPAGLFFAVQYAAGLANIEPVVNVSQKNRAFSLCVGYFFKQHPKKAKEPHLEK